MSKCFCRVPELQITSCDGWENMTQEGSESQLAAMTSEIPAGGYAALCLFVSPLTFSDLLGEKGQFFR